MKKVSILFIFPIIFLSCKGAETKKIMGKWKAITAKLYKEGKFLQQSKDMEGYIYEFKKNDEYQGFEYDKLIEKGSWSLSGDELQITSYKVDDAEKKESISILKVKELKQNSLILINESISPGHEKKEGSEKVLVFTMEVIFKKEK